MKAYYLSFDDIWKWIKDDDNVSLTAMQAETVFRYWERYARAHKKEEATFDVSLFCWWRETDDRSYIDLFSPKEYHITGYVDLEGKMHYLYSNKRNYSNPF